MARPAESVTGLVVRLQPVKDHDLIVTLLSAERGRLDTWARAGRKSTRRFGGRLGLFADLRAEVRVGRGTMPDLVSAEVSHQWLVDGASWPALAFASYAAELALVAAQPDHPDADLIDWLRACLEQAPSASVDLAGARLAAEIGFLHLLGSFPDVRRCGSCGGSTAGGAVWLIADEAPTCSSCVVGGARQLDAAALLALSELTRVEIDIRLAAELVGEARALVTTRVGNLLAQVLHAPLRSAASLDPLTRLAGGAPEPRSNR